MVSTLISMLSKGLRSSFVTIPVTSTTVSRVDPLVQPASLEHELGEAGAVAQLVELYAAQAFFPVDPTGDGHALIFTLTAVCRQKARSGVCFLCTMYDRDILLINSGV